ncbi:branched-chain amino acid aminotransferase [Pontivivens insulae]|uniref:Probable branched-chain-amino-acid aminotransferase n=1 Tax=Pontivivens insulae TaxID=1639689 RepID=A0A2R8ADX4_9RHOB|nr:branched-chain amino acid aminotransferase [Pontivivens insulae]RED14369.1 branched-chain amino acid aminotransferase [Pontivivens insulae]SPF30446.1 Branched-chain-amino-acid aminotransferase [Pontivivens insulae]
MAIGTAIKTWFDGAWHDGNTPILGAADHATWLGTLVFDGARSFNGVVPDLDLHCARVAASARAMGMSPPLEGPQIETLAREGVAMFPADTSLYIRPMMWSREGGPGIIAAKAESCAFALCLEDMPMPELRGLRLTLSPFRRPRPDMALTEAKAACLYPNNGRMLADAQARGFDNCISLDPDGNVAETATTNIFMVKDGAVKTPAANGTFLAGITRKRVMTLLSEDGYQVEEATLSVEDLAAADEMFMTGNASKITGVTGFEGRALQIGPVTRRARDLYWAWSGAS